MRKTLRLLTVNVMLMFMLINRSASAQSLAAWWQAEGSYTDSVAGIGAVLPFQYVAGFSGQAFDFNGAVMDVPDNASLRPTNITIQMYVKSPGPGAFKYLAAKASGGTYGLYSGGDGLLHFFCQTPVGEAFSAGPASASAIWDNNWHQVTAVFDGTYAYVYIDGIVQTSQAGGYSDLTGSGPANLSYPPGDLVFGDYTPGGGYTYSGLMDDVRIFNHALTASQVMDTYTNSASPSLTAGLISFYTADGNANDSVGNNNGTVIGASVSNFGFGVGKHGQGFSDTGGYIQLQDGPALRPASTVTVQAWVQSCGDGENQYIISRYPDYSIYTGFGGLTFFSVGYSIPGGGNNSTIEPAPLTVWDGAYHQITGVYDGTSNSMYVDGIKISQVYAGNYNMSFANPLTFGDYIPGAAGYTWAGLLDDVKIYDAALSDSQVMASFTADQDNALVGWWRAEGNALDFLGSNNGTFSGSYGSGKYVGSAFNTAGAVVVVPNSSSLQPANLTVEAIVKSAAPGANKTIIGKTFGGTGISFALTTGPTGGLLFSITTTSGIINSPVISTGQIWDNNYHGVAGSYDGSNVHLFLDGQEIGTASPASGAIQYDNGPLLFGDSSATVSSANFPGLIDDVRIYNSARTSRQIRSDIPAGTTILAQPESQVVQTGSNCTLSVMALSVLPPIDYQWMHAGTNLSGQTGKTLMLTNVQASQLGAYQVKLESSPGATYTTAVASNLTGSAFDFSQSGFSVDITNNGSLDLQQFTYQCWVRATNYPGNYIYVMAKSLYNNPNAAVGIYTAGSGSLEGYMQMIQTNTADPTTPLTNFVFWASVPTNIWDGNWHLVDFSWDGANAVDYMDGALVGSVDSTVAGTYLNGPILYESTTPPTGGDFILGGYSPTSVSTLKYSGGLDDVKIFDRALVASEVANEFSSPAANPTGLVSWWKGDGNMLDSAGTDNGFAFPEPSFETSEVALLTAPNVPASFANVNLAAGIFNATLTGPTGQSYIVESAGTLTNPNWTPVETNIVPFTISVPVTGGAKFYRSLPQ